MVDYPVAVDDLATEFRALFRRGTSTVSANCNKNGDPVIRYTGSPQLRQERRHEQVIGAIASRIGHRNAAGALALGHVPQTSRSDRPFNRAEAFSGRIGNR